MFDYKITFKDGKRKRAVADSWGHSYDYSKTWMIFYKANQEILRVKTDEIRTLERKPI